MYRFHLGGKKLHPLPRQTTSYILDPDRVDNVHRVSAQKPNGPRVAVLTTALRR